MLFEQHLSININHFYEGVGFQDKKKPIPKYSKSLYSNPIGLAADNNSSYLYVADCGNNAIRRITLDGSVFPVTTIAVSPLLGNPYGLAFDNVHRYLYVSSYSGQKILRLPVPDTDDQYVIKISSTNIYAGSVEGILRAVL